MSETWIQSLGREDPLEGGMVTHSNILNWTITWIEEPGRLQSMVSQRTDSFEKTLMLGKIEGRRRRG